MAVKNAPKVFIGLTANCYEKSPKLDFKQSNIPGTIAGLTDTR